MGRALHRLRRGEDGQALVLGAVTVLVLALAVLGTANVARTVHDRIRLQNAADAAAYTLAAHEARAFNFHAWTNRAQISQYVAVMQLVSLDAFLAGLHLIVGVVQAFVDTLGSPCDAGPCGAVLCEVFSPALVPMRAIAAAVDVAAQALDAAFAAFDAAVGDVLVPLIQAANRALYLLDRAYALAVHEKLLNGEGLAVARVAAPDALDLPGVSVALHALNAAAFERAHARASEELGGRDEDPGPVTARNAARRGMGELVQATRADFFVYDRTLPGGFLRAMGLPGGAVDAIGMLQGTGALRGVPGHTSLGSARSVEKSPFARIFGQTEEKGYGFASYPTGNVLVANQYLQLRPTGGVFDLPVVGEVLQDAFSFTDVKGLASVVTIDGEGGEPAGWHCGWKGTFTKIDLLSCATLFVPDVGCTHEDHHPWQGITPYTSFAAHPDLARGQNQPDVWVALQQGRPAAPGGMNGAAVEATVEVQGGATRASNADAGERWGDGMVAVARAQAYYHRPGTWKEPPTFFNPFWRARLAPVEGGVSRVPLIGAAVQAAPEALRRHLLTH